MWPSWALASTPGASLLAGVVALVALVILKKCTEKNGELSARRISSAVMLTASCYTMVVLVIGEFYLAIPVSETIRVGFGDSRVAWVLVYLIVDLAIRIASLFVSSEV
jgi:hypothetical protein